MLQNKYRFFACLVIIVGVCVSAAMPPNSVTALSGNSFRAGRIIDDSIFKNKNTMSANDIQNFLNVKMPNCDTQGTKIYSGTTTRAQYGASKGHSAPYICLKDYYENPSTHANNLNGNPIPSGALSAAQIIYNIAQQYNINPQVLLVMLQKEEGLVLDDWPWDSQYAIAMGYGCPDTAACNTKYYGFYNQLDNAAWQLNDYAARPSLYNFVTGPGNNIQYNPNAGCGSSTVTIQSQATASLYNYTPYQPNQAALNNLYGSGDSCSAYGNRNFWVFFNDWFGDSGGGIEVVTPDGGQGLFALYGGQKQLIQDVPSQIAWGLDKLPVVKLDQSTINGIPTRSTTLKRYAINPLSNPASNPAYLVADAGGTFDSTPSLLQTWGMNPGAASVIGNELVSFTQRLGNFSAFAGSSNAGCVFLVDGGTPRCLSSPSVLNTWAGSKPYVISISSNFFSSLGSLGGGIFNGQASSGGNSYMLDSGAVYSLPGMLSQIYPHSNPAAVSSSLLSTLPNAGNASRFITSPGIPGIYMVDNSQRLALASPGLMQSYLAPGESNIPINLSSTTFNTLTAGQAITNRFIYNQSNPSQYYYLLNTPRTLTSQYGANNYGIGLSATTISFYGQATGTACSNGFVSSSSGNSGIFLMDGGQRRPIANPTEYALLNPNLANGCELPQDDFAAIPSGSIIRPLVSNGGTNYILSGGKHFVVSATAQQAWLLTGYVPIGTSLLNTYSDGGILSNNLQIGNASLFITTGAYYTTTNPNMASIWGMNSTQSHVPLVVSFLQNKGTLSQFAVSNSPSQPGIFLVDQGKFRGIADPNGFFNAGYKGQNLVTVDNTYLTSNLAEMWQGYIGANSTDNTIYVLEGGNKHILPTAQQAKWLGSPQSVTPTPLSTAFLSLLNPGSDITNSFASPDVAGIYGMNNAHKFVIPNYATYSQSYAPYLRVDNHLVNAVPY